MSQKIQLSHHKRIAGGERLDLLTNDMLGITSIVDGKVYNLCDLGLHGFSFARVLEANKIGNYNNAVRFLTDKAEALKGKNKEFVLFFQGVDTGGMQITGTIRSFQFILSLNINQINMELTNLAKHLKQSPDSVLEQDDLIKQSELLVKKGEEFSTDKTNANLALNTTFVNLIEALGGNSSQTIDHIYDRYKKYPKPVFLKFGVQIDPLQGRGLLEFAKNRKLQDVVQAERKPPVNKEDKGPYLVQLNQEYKIEDFTEECWKNTTTAFGLNRELPLRTIELVDDRDRLVSEGYNSFDLKMIGQREYDGEMYKYQFKIELFADIKPDTVPGKMENCFVNSIAYYLDKSGMSATKAKIREVVRKTIVNTFHSYLRKVGWGLT